MVCLVVKSARRRSPTTLRLFIGEHLGRTGSAALSRSFYPTRRVRQSMPQTMHDAFLRRVMHGSLVPTRVVRGSRTVRDRRPNPPKSSGRESWCSFGLGESYVVRRHGWPAPDSLSACPMLLEALLPIPVVHSRSGSTPSQIDGTRPYQ
jgi:hypothetical protein